MIGGKSTDVIAFNTQQNKRRIDIWHINCLLNKNLFSLHTSLLGTSANRAVSPRFTSTSAGSQTFSERSFTKRIESPGLGVVVPSWGQGSADGQHPADSGVVPPWCCEVAGLSMCVSSAWFTTPAAAHTPDTHPQLSWPSVGPAGLDEEARQTGAPGSLQERRL